MSSINVLPWLTDTHFYSLAYSMPALSHIHCDVVRLLLYFLSRFLCQSHAYSWPQTDSFIDHSFTRYVSQSLSVQLASPSLSISQLLLFLLLSLSLSPQWGQMQDPKLLNSCLNTGEFMLHWWTSWQAEQCSRRVEMVVVELLGD